MIHEHARELATALCDVLERPGGVRPHFQPIVMLAGRQTVGYELLARSSLTGLENPAAMFSAAERLNQEVGPEMKEERHRIA